MTPDPVGLLRGIASQLNGIRSGKETAVPLDELILTVLERLAKAEKDLEARPTPEAWTISCRLIDAAIDKVHAALEGQTHFHHIHGLKNLVDALISDRDGWKTGSLYNGARLKKLEAAATAAERLYDLALWTSPKVAPAHAAMLWAELRDALGLKPGTATAAGVGSTASAAAIKSDPMSATGAVDLAMGVGIFGDSIGPTADVVRKIVEGVIGQREEILTAFVAKYGFDPDEAVQVVDQNGSWCVERRAKPAEPLTMTEASLMFRHIERSITRADRADFMLRDDIDVVAARKSSDWNWHVYRNGSILASALTKADCVDAAIRSDRSTPLT